MIIRVGDVFTEWGMTDIVFFLIGACIGVILNIITSKRREG